MRILVTGGLGYIGSHTTVALIEAGNEVLVYDDLSNASLVVLNRIEVLTGKRPQFVQADIRDTAALANAFDEFSPEAVVHFAGKKAVGESETDPLKYFEQNVVGSLRLVQAMDVARCRRIVFSSSATVYGPPEYLPYDEAHPKAPANTYGQTKLMVEQLLQRWTRANGDVSAACLRYFNPVGAHPSGSMGEDPNGVPENLMPYVAQVAIGKRKELNIFGDDYATRDGTGVRDYIHVCDLAEAHLAALSWTSANNGWDAWNIGSGSGNSVKELIAAFSSASGCEIPVRVTPRRPGDLPEYFADSGKANAQLGWSAKRSLQDMCRDSWNWQNKNPEGYR